MGDPMPALLAYDDIMQGPVQQFIKYAKQIGGDVATISTLAARGFSVQRQFLETAVRSKKPGQDTALMDLLRPTSNLIQEVQELREKSRSSKNFNHLSAISESIPALGWVTVSPTPGPFVKEMNDAGQFYTNRVLKEWKEKDKTHVEWCKSWVEILTELQKYIKQHHTTGLSWNPQGKDISGGGSAGGPPPPPPMGAVDFSDLHLSSGGSDDTKAALFSELNRGEGVTSGLKKVTADMQTHKNPGLRGTAPIKSSSQQQQSSTRGPQSAPQRPPKFALEGKKWIVENQKDNRDLLIDNPQMNQVVYMFNCENSTIQVRGKLNGIVVDSCKKSAVVFDSLVGPAEIINCRSVQIQVMGKVPIVSVDKTDGFQIYLSKESIDLEIVTAKSSEMNVMVPRNNGDYVEYAIPEQFKTTITPTGLKTTITEVVG